MSTKLTAPSPISPKGANFVTVKENEDSIDLTTGITNSFEVSQIGMQGGDQQVETEIKDAVDTDGADGEMEKIEEKEENDDNSQDEKVSDSSKKAGRE